MAYGRNGRGMLRPSRIGLGLTSSDFFADGSLPVIQDYASPYPSPDDITSVPSPDSDGLTTAPTQDYEPPVVAYSEPVAMPTATASGTNVTDGSAPTVTEMAAPDKTVIPVGSYVAITDQAWVISLPNGQTRIIYLNQPIVDPECANLTTADINAGKVCIYNVGVPGTPDYFEYRYIPTERWTGRVQSAGELRGYMDYAASLQPNAGGGGAFRTIWFNNPSWHMVTTEPSQVYDTAKFPDNYVPKYIGPTETSGGNKMYIIDTAGTPIDVTGGITSPEQKAAIDEAVYGPVDQRSPGQPGYVPPVYSGPPIDETGSIIHDEYGDGGGTSSPPFVPPTTKPPTGGNVTMSPAPAPSGTGMSTATLGLLALGAFLLLKRR
jgi:3D (Asp-Asp-Asp) domain-containing protein